MNEEDVLERGYAKTREEWWFLVDKNWGDLHSIIARFAPGNGKGAAKVKEDRDAVTLYNYLNAAWYRAPDKKWIHSIPGWGMLCDLCSDFPEDNKEETE